MVVHELLLSTLLGGVSPVVAVLWLHSHTLRNCLSALMAVHGLPSHTVG